jgi:AGZA family xanthine/uracil permease-like MFS transporter
MSDMEEKMAEYFDFEGNETDIKTEVIAGVTTFLATMYIIIVNPQMLSTCIEGVVCTGLDQNQLVTATVLVGAFSSIMMGVWAKNPYIMAPGMGLNAFFVWTVVISGTSAQVALGAVFLSGIIFIILSVLNIRTEIVKAVPASMRNAVAAGIGLFIAFIGLQHSGFIVDNGATLVGQGQVFGSGDTLQDYLNGTDMGIFLFIAGLILCTLLLKRGVKAAMIITIATITILSVFLSSIEIIQEGTAAYAVMPDSITADPDFGLIGEMDIGGALALSALPVVFTFLFTDMFDSISTFVGVSEVAGLKDEDGEPRNVKESLIVDGISTTISGLFGSSSGTTYIESAAGIEQGGRSGMTAVVAGTLFLPFLFLSPLLTMVPTVATSPILVLVGVFMMKPVLKIEWGDMEDALPAFMAMMMIPLTYSITNGIVWGFLTWSIIKAGLGKSDEVPKSVWVIDIFCLIYLLPLI